ncbi:MAG: hypothetical protein ACXWQ6_11580 [Candidatus Limnocylindrales bacterium]
MTGSRDLGSPEADATPAVPDQECLRCHGQLISEGERPFRVGGTSGGWHLLLGDWAELGEQTVAFEVLVCANCRFVELRNPAR